MENIKLKILCELRDLQCFEPCKELGWEDWRLNDDETPLLTYHRLEEKLILPKRILKPAIIDLRNSKLVELVTAYDYDYQISGSGWLLTENGVDFINKNLKKHGTNLFKRDKQAGVY